MKWEEFHDDWWDERRQPQPGDLETAWDALWEAMPSGWTVGKPQQDLVSKQWTASIVLVTGGTSRIGHMPRWSRPRRRLRRPCSSNSRDVSSHTAREGCRSEPTHEPASDLRRTRRACWRVHRQPRRGCHRGDAGSQWHQAVITKMLHLKRPSLVPVLDSLVIDQLGGRGRASNRCWSICGQSVGRTATHSAQIQASRESGQLRPATQRAHDSPHPGRPAVVDPSRFRAVPAPRQVADDTRGAATRVSRQFGLTELSQLAPGDSGVQRAAETVLLAALAVELGLTFGLGKRVMPEGTRVELDAISEEPPVLVEARSHQGPPKSAQKAHGHDRRTEARVGRGGTLPRRRAEDPSVGRRGGRCPLPRRELDVRGARPPGHRGEDCRAAR